MTPALEQIKALPAKPSPTYAPVYAAALYPQLAEMARKHGYALAVHGSLQRDFDLIAIPWVENPSEPQAFVDAITSGFAAKEVGGPPSEKPHGRRAWSLSIGFGTCAIDLSFMPALQALRDEAGEVELWLWRDGDRFLAFDNEYPCYPNGDPMTLGEPVGRAQLVVSSPRAATRPAPAAEAAPQGGDAISKLQAFKDYVHQRLDAMGVPIDPESPHKAAGCRIGGRLDYVESRLAAPRAVASDDGVVVPRALLEMVERDAGDLGMPKMQAAVRRYLTATPPSAPAVPTTKPAECATGCPPQQVCDYCQSAPVPQEGVDEAVNRFLSWPLPKDFAPDCGITFDGRHDDEWNKGKTWPVGTNLFTAVQAKAMFEYCLAASALPQVPEPKVVPYGSDSGAKDYAYGYEKGYSDGWNGCRAAMLAAAPAQGVR